MKKSILALGATVALGGLGFAGSAHALAVFGDDPGVGDAAFLALNAGGVGHILHVPYYSAQGSTTTMFSIVNTDPDNGKAVKVRFRGAANSDDVRDFTVYMSPGDVWTATLSPKAGDFGVLRTTDNSCTVPFNSAWAGGVPLSDIRLDQKLDDDVRIANANEGYIEILNMADIDMTHPLGTAIKHVDGVAPCTPAAFAAVQNTTWVEPADAPDFGLLQPTGGLMGSWAVMDQVQLAAFSGNMGAIVASDGAWAADGVTPGSGTGNYAFAPQLEAGYSDAPVGYTGTGALDELTADPLLRDGTIPPVWFDLPDMSTPLVVGGTAITEAENLSIALGRESIYNEYAADASASVPLATDWIVSQPTRRYHAAVDYVTGKIVWNIDMTLANTGTTDVRADIDNNIYAGLELKDNEYGKQACHDFNFSSTDREEKQVTGAIGGDFSPGVVTTHPYCGEVFVMSFNGGASPVNAVVTQRNINGVGAEGWAHLGPKGAAGLRLPIVGYAAIAGSNVSTGVHYGWTMGHRWDK